MKQKYNLFTRLFAVNFVLLLFTTCSSKNSNCYTETDVFLYAGFYDTLNRACTLSYVSVYGLDEDSLLYDSTSLSLLALPLKPNLDETSFVMTIVNDSTDACDTLCFYHTNNEWFLSMECNGIITHKLTNAKVTHHYIKSLTLEDREIKNEENIHVKLFVTP